MHAFSTIPTRSSTHDALVKQFLDLKRREIGLGRFFGSSGMEGRTSAPEGAKRGNGEIVEGSQRHPARYAEKQPSPYNRLSG